MGAILVRILAGAEKEDSYSSCMSPDIEHSIAILVVR